MSAEPPRIAIRPAVASDLPALVALYAECLRSGEGVFEDGADAIETQDRLEALLRDGAPFLVAASISDESGERRSGALAGFAHAARHAPGSGFTGSAQSTIWIAPAHRGRGLGWALLRDLVIACRQAGLRHLVAHARADSEAALALHASLNFRVIGWYRDACEVGGELHDIVSLRRVLDRIAPASAGVMVAGRPAAPPRGLAARLGMQAEFG